MRERFRLRAKSASEETETKDVIDEEINACQRNIQECLAALDSDDPGDPRYMWEARLRANREQLKMLKEFRTTSRKRKG